jgi:hypothetical protein
MITITVKKVNIILLHPSLTLWVGVLEPTTYWDSGH